MKIVTNYTGDYPDGPTVHINPTRFSNNTSKDEVLFCGYNSMFDEELKAQHCQYPNKYLFNLWMPTEYNCPAPVNGVKTLYQPDGKIYDYFNKVYSICPYTIQWLREETGIDKYVYIPHPFAAPDDYGGSSLNYDKMYDVCYFGGLHGPLHKEMAKRISKYNYRISYISNQYYITDFNLTHHQKMQLSANTRISIVFNQVPLRFDQRRLIRDYRNWESNKAWSRLDKLTTPQYKCRTAEAAFCKSVILVYKDEWNIIEDFFDIDEFVYFTDLDDMEYKINDILNNYDNYIPMLNKAYKKSLEYTGESVIRKVINGEYV